MDKNKWFGDKGYNQSGYIQITARLDYLEKEHSNISPEEEKYEIRVIQSLIDSIPKVNENTKKIHPKQVRSNT